MATRSTLLITTAPAGSGKTYVRGPRFLCDEYLLEGEGVHCSNFPLYADKIGEFVEKQSRGKLDAVDVAGRIERIPDDVFELWMDLTSGPWDYFKDVDINGWHIAIDECHNVCSSTHPAKHRERWGKWLGEIRHRGATVELISQDPSKIAPEVIKESETRYVLINAEKRRDPFFGCLLGDWYELRAKFVTGSYNAAVWLYEKRKVDGRFYIEDKRTFRMEPRYFALYDSYSTPHSGGTKAKAPKREFQKRGYLSLLAWFGVRNLDRLSWRIALFVLVCWVCFFGGGSFLLEGFQRRLLSAGKEQIGKAASVSAGQGREEAPEHLASRSPDELRVLAANLQAEVEQLRSQRVEVSKERDELRFMLDAIQQRVGDSFSVEMIGRQSVQFRNGYRYSTGETIDWGPYEGRKVVLVDWNRRTARLDDGTLLRMGDPTSSVSRGLFGSFLDGEESEAEVPGSLPGGGGGGAQPRSGVQSTYRRTVNGVGRSDAAAEVPQVDQQRSGRVSDRRGEFR